MQPVVQRLGAIMLVLAVAACGNSSGPNPPPTLTIDCTGAPVTTLAVGGFAILDASQNGGCARLPAAGAGGAEHLLIALSASKTNSWTEGYNFRGKSLGAVAAPQPVASLPSPRLAAFSQPLNSLDFHQMLREQEHGLAASPAAHLFAAAPLGAPAPPVLNSQRSFWVCSTTACTSFTSVTATAKYVGAKGAIYLDNTVPTGGYTQQEIDTLGALFDSTAVPAVPNMYAIDTTAFGRESDRDNNGVVIILLTDALNKLSPNCNTTQQVALGYFFGLDLISDAHSNNGEVFYSLVPDPNSTATTNCTIPKAYAKSYLPPTFIHEFQHMISWNQHVIVGGSPNSEDTWLNEGLSHFAEELGGRELPDDHRFGGAFSNGTPMTRLTQFAGGDFDNAFTYLTKPETNFLVYDVGGGSLAERGAAWLFVRWLADHFGTDALGNGLTQPLVQTALRGAANVQSATGGTRFDTLVVEWQMANYFESDSTWVPLDSVLVYKTWNLQRNFVLNFGSYPLVPDLTSGTYSRSAKLRAGSGRHVRVVQGASAAAVDFQLSTQTGTPLSATTAGRIGVVRIR